MEEVLKGVSIAVVEPIGGHGGNEFYDFGLCKSVAEEGFDVCFYTCDETVLDTKFSFPFIIKKPFVKIYGKDNKYLRGVRFLLAINRILKDLKKRNVKLVHMHFYHFSWLEYIMLKYFSKNGRQVVGTVHDVETFDKYGKELNTSKYSKFEKLLKNIIVHTSFAKESLLTYFKSINPDSIRIVPHGDTDFLYSTTLSKQEAKQNLKLPTDKIVILFFGQIKKVKGVEVLLRAFSEVLKQRQDVHLVVAGNPWKLEMDEINSIIRENNLGQHGSFIFGYIDNETVPLYFRAADVVALPYLKIYSSGVLLRAMDYGSCIIGSDVDAFSGVIEEGKNGLLFECGNFNDLADKILSELDKKEWRESMAANAKKTVDKRFSWKIVGQKTAEVYRQALKL